jgi:hypothetical protein
MEPTLQGLIQLSVTTPGRRIVALRKMRDVARDMGLSALVERIDEAIESDLEERQIETLWLAIRNRTRVHGAEMPGLDSLADRLVKAIHDNAASQVLGAEAAFAARVARFIEAILPAGVYAITSLPYAEQAAALEVMVRKLTGELAADVEDFGLTRLVERLVTVSLQYRKALHVERPIRFADVQEARRRGMGNVLEIAAMVLGKFCRLDVPAHDEARRKLLGPMVEQHEAICAYRRGRRALQDIDPDTGEPDLEGIDDTPAAELSAPDAGPAPDTDS